MKKMQLPARMLATMASLTVGGCAGSALGVAAFLMAPGAAQSDLTLRGAMTAGAIVGTALHRLIAPVLDVLNYYRVMFELDLHARLGWVSRREMEALRRRRARQYFDRPGPSVSNP